MAELKKEVVASVSPPGVAMASLRAEAEATLAEAAGILSAHYGEEDDRCREARTKLEQLKL